MAFRYLEKPKTTLAGRSLVREFAEMEPAPYDRPLSERRLQVYERILRAGEFRPVTWAAAACRETNCTYRVNGKHTATMLSKLDPVPEFYVTVERYVCDTLAEVAHLYNTFDSKLGARTTADINLAFAATMPELRDVPIRLVHLTITAASFQRWGDKTDKTPAERAEELLENGDFARWLAETVPNTSGRTPCSHLVRAPVVNAMLATYRRSKTPATDFWALARDEAAPDRDDPTRVLARYLIRATLARSDKARGKSVATGREMYAKCLHAWNAWRRGERTALNYHADKELPAAR